MTPDEQKQFDAVNARCGELERELERRKAYIANVMMVRSGFTKALERAVETQAKQIQALYDAFVVLAPSIGVLARDDRHAPSTRAEMLKGEKLMLAAMLDVKNSPVPTRGSQVQTYPWVVNEDHMVPVADAEGAVNSVRTELEEVLFRCRVLEQALANR